MSRTDQPSGVHTQDVPRPPDNSVVTDETTASGQGAAAAGKDPKKGSEKTGSNNQDSATGKSQEDDSQTQQPRRDRYAEKRIRKLNRRLAAERDRNTANDRRIATLEQQLQTLNKRPAGPPAAEPQLKEFETPQKFAKAYAQWETDQEAAKAAKPAGSGRQPPAERSEPQAQRKSDTARDHADEKQIAAFHERGKKKLGDDFLDAREAAAANEFGVNKVMGDFILDSEFGPEIFTYLADNPELSQRIYDKSETFAVKALEELAAKAKEGKLMDSDPDDGAGDTDDDETDDAKDRDKSRPKKGGRGKSDGGDLERRATKAPDPKKTGDDRGAPNAPVDLEKLDMDAYAQERHKQLERGRRH